MVRNTGRWPTALRARKKSILSASTLQFLLLMPDGAVMKLKGYLLRELTLMPKKQAEVEELKAKETIRCLTGLLPGHGLLPKEVVRRLGQCRMDTS